MIVGVEGLLKGYPADKMPKYADANNELRYKMLNDWLKSHGVGQHITLRGLFRGTTPNKSTITAGLSNYRPRQDAEITHPSTPFFSASAELPDSASSNLLTFKSGENATLTGEILNVEASPAPDGMPVLSFKLGQATLSKGVSSR